MIDWFILVYAKKSSMLTNETNNSGNKSYLDSKQLPKLSFSDDDSLNIISNIDLCEASCYYEINIYMLKVVICYMWLMWLHCLLIIKLEIGISPLIWKKEILVKKYGKEIINI